MKIFCLLLFSVSLFAQDKPSISTNHFIVIAHRGNHTHAPENTMKAFQEAVNAGVDYVEVDLRSTKDGKLMIMHDQTIDRMTNGKGKVDQLSWKEIETFKVSDKNHPEWGTYPIPTFREVLEYCKGKVKIYLDFKDASVTQTRKELHEMEMDQSIVVYINSKEQYVQWRALSPTTPLMISLPENLDNKNKLLDFLKDTDAEILDGSYLDYTLEKTEVVHQMNRKIWADIQQEKEDTVIWEKALSLNIDGLQTDHPAELIEFLKKKRLR